VAQDEAILLLLAEEAAARAAVSWQRWAETTWDFNDLMDGKPAKLRKLRLDLFFFNII
jgi:hypothetical protein